MALVQSKTYGSSASSASHSVTLNAAPTSGNLLILCVVSDTTISGTPTGWSVGNSAVDFTGTYLYYKIAGASESATITVGLSSSDSCALFAYEYSSSPAAPLDKSASAVGQSNPINTGTTATTTQADELLFALVGISVPTTEVISSWSNSFIQLDVVTTTGSASNVRAATASRTVSATGAYTTSATMNGTPNADSSGIIATFKVTPAHNYALSFFARLCEFNVQRLA